MKKVTFLLWIFMIIIASCHSNRSKSTQGTQRTDTTDMLDGLKKVRGSIDTLFDQSKEKLIVFAKVSEEGEPILITDGKFPGKVHLTINILKDSSGNIIRISEIPFSESGDWIIILTHYFDKAGKTFAHKRQADFYNSICTDGMAHDERVEYYDSNNKLLEKAQTLVDDKKNTLQKESCQFPYEYEYRISEDLGKYLQTKHLKIN